MSEIGRLSFKSAIKYSSIALIFLGIGAISTVAGEGMFTEKRRAIASFIGIAVLGAGLIFLLLYVIHGKIASSTKEISANQAQQEQQQEQQQDERVSHSSDVGVLEPEKKEYEYLKRSENGKERCFQALTLALNESPSIIREIMCGKDDFSVINGINPDKRKYGSSYYETSHNFIQVLFPNARKSNYAGGDGTFAEAPSGNKIPSGGYELCSNADLKDVRIRKENWMALVLPGGADKSFFDVIKSKELEGKESEFIEGYYSSVLHNCGAGANLFHNIAWDIKRDERGGSDTKNIDNKLSSELVFKNRVHILIMIMSAYGCDFNNGNLEHVRKTPVINDIENERHNSLRFSRVCHNIEDFVVASRIHIDDLSSLGKSVTNAMGKYEKMFCYLADSFCKTFFVEKKFKIIGQTKFNAPQLHVIKHILSSLKGKNIDFDSESIKGEVAGYFDLIKNNKFEEFSSAMESDPFAISQESISQDVISDSDVQTPLNKPQPIIVGVAGIEAQSSKSIASGKAQVAPTPPVNAANVNAQVAPTSSVNVESVTSIDASKKQER